MTQVVDSMSSGATLHEASSLETVVLETAAIEMFMLKEINQPVLIFSPAPAFPAERPVPADRPSPLVRPRRRFRMDWYEIAVITLILSCAALCVYRLMWAIQP